jgi:hypothetical protein
LVTVITAGAIRTLRFRNPDHCGSTTNVVLVGLVSAAIRVALGQAGTGYDCGFSVADHTQSRGARRASPSLPRRASQMLPNTLDSFAEN